jgi:integral membrane sensor domain MASE1
MNEISAFLTLILLACIAASLRAQQASALQQPPQKEQPSHQSEFFQKATNLGDHLKTGHQ